MSEILEYTYYHGRRIIFTSAKEINDENVIEELNKAISIHKVNRAQIKYLYNYYKGKQPILDRKKEVRPEIQNDIVENTAYEITSFKSSYLLGEPCTYVRRGEDDNASDGIAKLNDYMFTRDKASQDKILADWLHIAGIGYRIILPTSEEEEMEDEEECPFIMDVINPMNTFILYNSGVGKRKLMGVTYTYNGSEEETYTVYTPNNIYKICRGEITKNTENHIGLIPIIEYRANTALMGAFEPVLDELNALNTIQSNRVDDVEQIVQAFLKFIGCDINDDVLQTMKDEHVLILPNGTDCGYVLAPLDQQQIQTLVDYTYSRILTICGMPATQNGGASTSDTGVAVMYRDGWKQAEANASDTELFFKKAEKEMLRVVLKLCKEMSDINLKLSDIDIKFTRRQYEASLTKAQTLITMLEAGIEPKVAFPICGLFYDPTDAYEQSKELLEYKWGIASGEERNEMPELQQEIV